MLFLYSFLFAGTVCLIGQILLDNTKLTAGHITTLFVVIGTILDIFDIYDKFIVNFGGGAIVLITSFGHLLMHGAIDKASEIGYLGLSLGMFDLTASGITIAIVSAFLVSLIFKPKN